LLALIWFTPLLLTIITSFRLLNASVGKSIIPLRAVHDLSFEVGAGEIVGLLGLNGAGKTTVMNMIAGLVRPTDGTIEIKGLDVFP